MEQLLQFQERLYKNADARNELFEKKYKKLSATQKQQFCGIYSRSH